MLTDAAGLTLALVAGVLAASPATDARTWGYRRAEILAAAAQAHDGHLPRLLDQMQQCLAGHFDLEHSTFQFEPAGHAEHEHHAAHT